MKLRICVEKEMIDNIALLVSGEYKHGESNEKQTKEA